MPTARSGTKLEQYKPLEELLDQYHDVTWIGAHMGGNPEDLDWLHDFLGRHPNYVIDCSATKGKRNFPETSATGPACRGQSRRVLFGSDIVVG